jgi:MFS family permease
MARRHRIFGTLINTLPAQLAYQWKVMVTVAVAVGIWMIVLDSTVVNVAFPTLRREFNSGLESIQWVFSIYVLALGIATPLAGFFADRFVLKRVYLVGLSFFVLGSLFRDSQQVCGL